MCVSIDEIKKFGYSVTIKIKQLFNRLKSQAPKRLYGTCGLRFTLAGA